MILSQPYRVVMIMYSKNENENAADYCLIRAWQELDDVIALVKTARVAGRTATDEQVLDGDAMVALTHIPTLVSNLRKQSELLESIAFRVTGLRIDDSTSVDDDKDEPDE